MKTTLIEKLLKRAGFISVKKISDTVMNILPGSVDNMGGFTPSTQPTYSTFVDNYKSWVYTTIDKIAKTVAMLPLELYVYKSKGTKINGLRLKNKIRYLSKEDRVRYFKANSIEQIRVEGHPFLDLLDRPNIVDTRMTLWINIVTRLEMAGSCPVYFPKNALGIPFELWYLPIRKSGVFSVIPSSTNVIGGYKYTDGELVTTFNVDEISYMKYPNPATPFEGLAPLSTQTYSYDIDLLLMQQQYALLKNKAVFGNVFGTDQQLIKAEVDALRSQIDEQFSGALRTGKPIVTHSGLKLDNTKLNQNSNDLQSKEMSDQSRDKLITSYDVSPTKLGLDKEVNRATAEVMDASYYAECIRPKTMLIEEYFEKDILPLYDEALTLDFTLPEFTERELDLREQEQDLKNGVRVINEVRNERGMEPVSWGEEPWLPFNLSQPSSITVPSSDIKPEPVKTKSLTPLYWNEERKKKTVEIFTKEVEVRKDYFLPPVRKHFNEQLEDILNRLEESGKSLYKDISGWSRQKVRGWLSRHKDRLSDININKEEEALKLIETTKPVYVKIIDEVGNERLSSLGVEVEFNSQDSNVEKYLGSRLKAFSTSVENTTFEEVDAILREGFQEGVGTTEIAVRLREKFSSYDKYRAASISRTETISSSNFSDLEGVKQSGIKLGKFWLREADARQTHAEAGDNYSENNLLTLDELFLVGTDLMLSPGNGMEARENINCRCTLGYAEINK